MYWLNLKHAFKPSYLTKFEKTFPSRVNFYMQRSILELPSITGVCQYLVQKMLMTNALKVSI